MKNVLTLRNQNAFISDVIKFVINDSISDAIKTIINKRIIGHKNY